MYEIVQYSIRGDGAYESVLVQYVCMCSMYEGGGGEGWLTCFVMLIGRYYNAHYAQGSATYALPAQQPPYKKRV